MAVDRDTWFKFFPSDWRGDEALRLCSLAARGFWAEALCLAHRWEGRLLVGGEPPDPEVLARLVSSTPAEVRKCLKELTANNVCSVDEHGVIYSRRMARDAHRRKVNRINGRHGGNPGLVGRSHNRLATDSDNTQILEAKSHKPGPEDRELAAGAAPTKPLLQLFDSLHQQRLGSRAAIRNGKDAKLIAELWRQRGKDAAAVERLIRAFFASQDDFIVKAGFTVGVFVSQVGKLLANQAEPKRLRTLGPAYRNDTWQDECDRHHGGRCRNATFHDAKRTEEAGNGL